MVKRLQTRRLLVLAALIIVGFAGLGARLVYLQAVCHDQLAGEARDQTRRVYRLEPKRGDILDAKGNLLATSVFVKTVCADPSLLSNHWSTVARTIAPLLEMDESDLARRIAPRNRTNDRGETVPVQYVVLKRKVSLDAWDRIHESMAKISLGIDENRLKKSEQRYLQNLRKQGIFADPVDDQMRIYPNGGLAAHVLGYVGVTERTNNGVRCIDTLGMDGIEKTLNDKLTGIRGWRVTERDGFHRELVAWREQDVEPRDGLNAVLTIDSVIQHHVEAALVEGMQKYSPNSISAIVVRPNTGAILAMATLPSYDPNNLPASTEEGRHNRIINEVAEPGSTFKIVVVSGALNDNTVGLDEVFDCEGGQFLYAGKVLHDHEHYNNLSVLNIITKSSNIGAAKIGIKMGQDRLFEYIRAFGMGQRTGIPLPAESPGILAKLPDWKKISIARIPMGQGVATTSLQMAMAMSAIANRGVLMRPMLIDRLVDGDGEVVARYQPQPVRRVMGESANRDIITALKSVITTDGTAAKAALDHYTDAGKTGTAEKIENGVYVKKFYSSFIGFFPADDPQICIYVALDEPKGTYYGGQVAAPIFKQIAEKAANYLNIRPDKNMDTVIPAVLGMPTPNSPARPVTGRSP
jgi:cell division protein FtsI/penicillin-binding protein 2